MPSAYTKADDSVVLLHDHADASYLSKVPLWPSNFAAPGPDLEPADDDDDELLPTHPVLRFKAAHGDFTYTLPESIYSAVIVSMLAPTTFAERLVNSVSAFISLTVSYVAQFTFISYLHKVLDDPDEDNVIGDCTGGDTYLRVLALSCFASLVLKDVLQTYHMVRWLAFFKTCDAPEPLVVGRFRYTRPLLYTAYVYRPTSGITRGQQLVIYPSVIIGKALLAAYIGYVGSGVVLRSPDDFGLVMNSLAAGFVLELDNFAFAFFLPPTLSVFLTASIEHPFGRAAEEAGILYTLLGLGYTVIIGAGLAVVVVALYAAWC